MLYEVITIFFAGRHDKDRDLSVTYHLMGSLAVVAEGVFGADDDQVGSEVLGLGADRLRMLALSHHRFSYNFV